MIIFCFISCTILNLCVLAGNLADSTEGVPLVVTRDYTYIFCVALQKTAHSSIPTRPGTLPLPRHRPKTYLRTPPPNGRVGGTIVFDTNIPRLCIGVSYAVFVHNGCCHALVGWWYTNQEGVWFPNGTCLIIAISKKSKMMGEERLVPSSPTCYHS